MKGSRLPLILAGAGLLLGAPALQSCGGRSRPSAPPPRTKPLTLPNAPKPPKPPKPPEPPKKPDAPTPSSW